MITIVCPLKQLEMYTIIRNIKSELVCWFCNKNKIQNGTYFNILETSSRTLEIFNLQKNNFSQLSDCSNASTTRSRKRIAWSTPAARTRWTKPKSVSSSSTPITGRDSPPFSSSRSSWYQDFLFVDDFAWKSSFGQQWLIHFIHQFNYIGICLMWSLIMLSFR